MSKYETKSYNQHEENEKPASYELEKATTERLTSDIEDLFSEGLKKDFVRKDMSYGYISEKFEIPKDTKILLKNLGLDGYKEFYIDCHGIRTNHRDRNQPSRYGIYLVSDNTPTSGTHSLGYRFANFVTKIEEGPNTEDVVNNDGVVFEKWGRGDVLERSHEIFESTGQAVMLFKGNSECTGEVNSFMNSGSKSHGVIESLLLRFAKELQ